MLKQIASVALPTHWARFRLLGFELLESGRDSRFQTGLALTLGNMRDSPLLVRIHSQCLTGEAFHSLRCDCHDQLHLALRGIAEQGSGLLIYEMQEGRGIGLMEKLRAYELQDAGLDTVDANLRLGHEVDARDYTLATSVLHFFGVRAIRLITNNPDKVRAVTSSGIEVVERISANVPCNPESAHYMTTKRVRLGHFFDAVSDARTAAIPGDLPVKSAARSSNDIELTFPGQRPPATQLG